MSKRTITNWYDHIFNLVEGCQQVSEGCEHCYAEAQTQRSDRLHYWGPGRSRKPMSDAYWQEPRRWAREAASVWERRRVLCGSRCDVFEDHVMVSIERERLWALIRETPHLDWLLLTKQAERIAACLPPDWPLLNVWLGVSIESAEYAWRADHLRAIPAAVRFVSYEPALGPLAEALDLTGIDWLIYGGEFGPQFRRDDPQWARAMRDRCQDAGVAFLYKQAAGRRQSCRATLDGVRLQALPTPRRGVTAGTVVTAPLQPELFPAAVGTVA